MHIDIAARLIELEIGQLRRDHMMANPTDGRPAIVLNPNDKYSSVNSGVLKLVLKSMGFMNEFIFSEFVVTEFDSLVNAFMENFDSQNLDDIKAFLNHLSKVYEVEGGEYSISLHSIPGFDIHEFDAMYHNIVNS